MRNPLSLLRVLSVVTVLGIAVWITWPQGVDASSRTSTAEFVPERIADGFDFPVGSNGSAAGYYMARKMTPFGHLGDDWNGVGGGNSDYGDPVYSIADGVVVYSENFGSNWGQVIIVRHKYRESDGSVRKVDSLYGHVINRRVAAGSFVRRGQQIAQIGNNNGMYLAHLHLEIRSNTAIGIQSWNHSKGLSNYHRPDQFIARHRPGKRVDPGLRLASAETLREEKPEPVKVVQAPVRVAAASPVSPSSAEAALRPRPVVSVESAAVKTVSLTSREAGGFRKAEPALARGVKRAPKVVDELAKVEPRSFFGGGHPERIRRSREAKPEKPAKASSKGRRTADRRRRFGKQ